MFGKLWVGLSLEMLAKYNLPNQQTALMFSTYSMGPILSTQFNFKSQYG